jgi:hypothetical protein
VNEVAVGAREAAQQRERAAARDRHEPARGGEAPGDEHRQRELFALHPGRETRNRGLTFPRRSGEGHAWTDVVTDGRVVDAVEDDDLLRVLLEEVLRRRADHVRRRRHRLRVELRGVANLPRRHDLGAGERRESGVVGHRVDEERRVPGAARLHGDDERDLGAAGGLRVLRHAHGEGRGGRSGEQHELSSVAVAVHGTSSVLH